MVPGDKEVPRTERAVGASEKRVASMTPTTRSEMGFIDRQEGKRLVPGAPLSVAEQRDRRSPINRHPTPRQCVRSVSDDGSESTTARSHVDKSEK